VAILVVTGLIGLYQTIDLNFFNYDNDDVYYVYVYAHTKRGTKDLVDEIEKFASQGNEGGKTGITIVSPDYWPLPWYLRNYSRVGYYGRMSPSTEPLIIASETQRAEVESTFGDRYQQIISKEPGGVFSLRPGVNLLLYARRSGVPQ
jgi:predicted membrane-bound mannosyltransferase